MSFGGDYYILFSLFMSSSCNWMEDMEGGILFLVKKIEMDKLLFNSLFFQDFFCFFSFIQYYWFVIVVYSGIVWSLYLFFVLYFFMMFILFQMVFIYFFYMVICYLFYFNFQDLFKDFVLLVCDLVSQ